MNQSLINRLANFVLERPKTTVFILCFLYNNFLTFGMTYLLGETPSLSLTLFFLVSNFIVALVSSLIYFWFQRRVIRGIRVVSGWIRNLFK